MGQYGVAIVPMRSRKKAAWSRLFEPVPERTKRQAIFPREECWLVAQLSANGRRKSRGNRLAEDFLNLRN